MPPESAESWRVLSSSEVPDDEETGFLFVAVITTRFTDEQCLPSSLATRKDIESCLCPLSFAVEVTRNLSSPSSFVYNNISFGSGAKTATDEENKTDVAIQVTTEDENVGTSSQQDVTLLQAIERELKDSENVRVDTNQPIHLDEYRTLLKSDSLRIFPMERPMPNSRNVDSFWRCPNESTNLDFSRIRIILGDAIKTGGSRPPEASSLFADIEAGEAALSARVGISDMKSKKKKLKKLTEIVKNRVTRVRRRKRNQGKRFNIITQALNYFCSRTTLHGLRYVVDTDLHIIVRFLWLILFILSSTVASNVIYSLALRFQAAPTSIGIESMHYETSNLPFPSVTLCPNDRVDWNRALKLEPRIFRNGTDKESFDTFREILGKLSVMSFGDFDDLDFLKNRSLHSLADIDVTYVLREVMPRCDQLLSECWWRNETRDCCEIFQVQKTEYGFCYSFNSELAETPPTNPAEARPRKATGYGDWSGVKVTIHLGNITKPPNSGKDCQSRIRCNILRGKKLDLIANIINFNISIITINRKIAIIIFITELYYVIISEYYDTVEISGVIVIVNGPHVWPNSGTMIATGSRASMALECISGYATQRVLELDNDKQPCRYDDIGVYNQETCLSLCKRYWVAKYCDCNLSFLFPASMVFCTQRCLTLTTYNSFIYILDDSFRECTIEDFICLINYNDLFNDYMVTTTHLGDEYPHDIPSMFCNCLPECDYHVCGTQFSNVPLHNMNDVTLDVHYIRQTSFRYKTDIVITQMDLLVSFGGIIGLFLGGSLLSAVELVYYLFVAMFSSLRLRCRIKEEPRIRSSATLVHTVLPILDYSPLKPRARKIPIFAPANYGLPESNSNRY
ncbi:uncharacterized protein LOC105426075 [Pogonomyrmex barbatus]|uniref:Uncharacterized protein LOC105426075 n=1 Tax=Pogonomyrmex barbatus TaxID=144034 RepID=A0A8N1S4Y3_9HYME|nr:uncharacterized protein LOC105426075 [Pogonomyrmex barbatus]